MRYKFKLHAHVLKSIGKRRELTQHSIICTATCDFQVIAHEYSWPFRQPVNNVVDYYDIIKYPMGKITECSSVVKTYFFFLTCIDLKTMTERLKARYYVSRRLFTADMTRIFTNCRIYNAIDTDYYKCAVNLQQYFQTKMKELGLWDR